MLHKNFILPSYLCIMCNRLTNETRDHLFFECPFARACWSYLCSQVAPQSTIHANISSLRKELKVPFHLEITAMVTWSIRKTRNDCIFEEITPSLFRCKKIFNDELNLVFHRAKRQSYHTFKQWIDAFR
ncbi:hypothetical protein BRADI_3g21967v3 [Brachypodium distachyon]|uniref:Reverse transcriptase zinc-binding domain-containing protein n=1 Tax=Brachypodium distachyon TaxID=15368 RepID=A0A2K2CYR1_BRADI|nr:hypothetical protein BRADI_3g21967v3 [Brachypodium distachyon]